MTGPTKRVVLELSRPWFAFYASIRPTVVIDGRGQPAQWGRGTWQLPAEGGTIGVYLFARLWRFGAASIDVARDDAGPLIYRAPALPFRPGRFRS